jgi:hypothetical protein
MLSFRCDLDCDYVVTARIGGKLVTRRGRAIGNADKRVALGRLRPGRYVVRIAVMAPLNPGPIRTISTRLSIP